MNRDHTSSIIEWKQPAERYPEAQGCIEHQVNIRGFRIDPAEIESAIEGIPGVKQCAAVACEDSRGDKQLVAYLVADRQLLPAGTELRNILKEKLPSYMMPAMFVKLEDMPRTSDGKVNRQGLPIPDPALLAYSEVFVEPRTPSEELLAEIWSDVLGVTRIGINDNFFELGGHSQLIAEVLSRVNKAFQVTLPINALFDFPTVAELASVVESILLQESPGSLHEHSATRMERPIPRNTD